MPHLYFQSYSPPCHLQLPLNLFIFAAKKAKAFISLMLQRSSTGSSSGGVTVRGTVEFVYSGSRVKILIPSESCLLQLTLSQIRCPLAARGASANTGAARVGEPFADESKRFTRRNLMHRQVKDAAHCAWITSSMSGRMRISSIV